jgi:hypothetical protein
MSVIVWITSVIEMQYYNVAGSKRCPFLKISRLVSGSSPLVGSIFSNTYRCFSLHPQVTVTWIVT